MIRDLLGNRTTDELLQEMQIVWEQIQTLGWKELRPWNEFFATFKPPQLNSKHLEQRVTTNFLHYRSNYAVICLGILCTQVLFTPMILISTVTIFGFYTFLMHLYKKPLVIGDFVFDETGKRYIVMGVSSLVLFLSGTILSLLWALFYSVLLCVAHMVFRPRSVSSKSNRVYEEMKLSGMNIFGFMGSSGLSEELRSGASGSGSRAAGSRSSGSSKDDVEDPSYYSKSYENIDDYNVRKRGSTARI